MIRPNRRAALFAVGVALAPIAGCGGGPSFGTVIGKVTFDDKPLAGASITARQKVGGADPVTAVSNGDGSFQIDDVPTGEVLFSVQIPPPQQSAEVLKGVAPAPAAPAKPAIILPPDYNNPGTSGLTTTVKPKNEGATEYDLVLKSKK